jgi:phage regulator Rha-like protein
LKDRKKYEELEKKLKETGKTRSPQVMMGQTVNDRGR